MGTYYGVKEVIINGTQVNAIRAGEILPRISKAEAIIAILWNGVQAIAADVTSLESYKYFYGIYATGNYLRILLYKISKDDLEMCPDVGELKTFDINKTIKEIKAA